MKLSKPIIAILLLAAACDACLAQGLRIFSSDGSLSSCLINNIYQDSRGYIWIATEYGLNRFDGMHFDTFKHLHGDSTSLCDNYVRTIHENNDGSMLIGSLTGLMKWDRATERFTRVNLMVGNKPVTTHVTEISELSSGDIWIGTAGYGLFRYDRASSTAVFDEKVSKSVGTFFISCIYEDSSHAVWIGTENSGVCRYYFAGDKARCYRAPLLGGNHVTSILEGDDGEIFVGTLDGGVDRLDPAGDRFSHLDYAGGALSVKSLVRYNDRYYVGTEGEGIKAISGNRVENLQSGEPLRFSHDSKVHQMLVDRDGNLWVGMFQRGIALLPSRKFMFEYFGRKSRLSNPVGNGCVMALAADDNHHLWVCCDNDGIYELDENRERLRKVQSSSTPLCMLRDSRGRRWVGTYAGGLMELLPGGTLSPVNGFASLKIYSIVEDAGGCLYLGTLGRGLIRYNPDSGEIGYLAFNRDAMHDSNLQADWINSLCHTSDGNIWIAHYNGVGCYNIPSRSYRTFSNRPNLIEGCIGYAVVCDSGGRIWMGTSDGLYVRDTDGAVSRFTTADGLPNDVVCGICEDEGRNIWVSTYHGIAKLIPGERRFVNFDSGDGLQGNEFTHGAVCKDSRGVIYFGGTNGVTAFHPFDIGDTPRHYRPVITRMDILDRPVNTTSLSGGHPIVDCEISEAQRVKLAPADNTLTLYFSTLTFDNPDKLAYDYRILEHGKAWLMTSPGQGRITFSNMSPGTYHFQVRVHGDASPDGMRELVIEIERPWYLSWMAFAGYLILLALLVLASVRYYRAKAMIRRQRQTRQQEEQILEAKLQFFTNISHEIRTPMTLIINPIESLMAETADPRLKSVYTMIYRNAKRILRLVNQLMDMRKLEKGQMSMHFRETDLVPFIVDAMAPFEFVAAENDIAFTFNHAESSIVAWIDTENFDKVIMNILSNAFKYTPKGGAIDITLRHKHDSKGLPPFEGYVEIIVADNGVGIDADKLEQIFDRFYRIENEFTSSNLGTGIGLHLCRTLVRLHHGSIHARNRMTESGCEFIIRLPEGSAHLSSDEISTGSAPSVPVKRDVTPAQVEAVKDKKASKSRTGRSVVVVEDDAEIRNYLLEILSPEFKVTAFPDGAEAWHSILVSPPDLIVSDVMMPGMDGITLCRKVKQNVNINHTPVILLSAKAENEDRVDGLAAGADAYLAKPFSAGVLQSTIDNLLSNRHLLRAKFSGAQAQESAVKKIVLKSQDEILLRRIMDVVNANLASPDFSVEMLASEVGLSRVHLHRKLKELTDLSAREFIKSLRMKQAARLLREKKLSVAEVAYATGFANPSHFSNAFKEIYGMTPTRYASEKIEDEAASV